MLEFKNVKAIVDACELVEQVGEVCLEMQETIIKYNYWIGPCDEDTLTLEIIARSCSNGIVENKTKFKMFGEREHVWSAYKAQCNFEALL